MNEKLGTSGGKIAVIAIHGVGDHLPEQMAKAACELLESRQTTAGETRYEAFRKDRVRIKIAAVRAGQAARPSMSGKPAKPTWRPFDGVGLSEKPAMAAEATRKDSVDHLFLEGQLAGYTGRGSKNTYDFLRLKALRSAEPEIPEKHVHIYDMFWSDLSGVGASD